MAWGFRSVTRDGDIITIHSLQNADSVNDFIGCVRNGERVGYSDFIIEFDDIHSSYPNAVVPIAGLIDFYKSVGMSFECASQDKNLQPIIKPYCPSINQEALDRPLSKIWQFQNSKEVATIHTSIVNELRRSDTFAEGVLAGIEWTIYEIMDNVLNHAESSSGFIMAQLHKTSKHIAITIYDAGIGIYNSLKHSIHKPKRNADALSICVRAGITRDKKVGQGNGMHGLYSLVQEGGGSLTITSGRDAYILKDGHTNIIRDKYLHPRNNRLSTTIDFQLDYSQNISIDKVLTFNGVHFDFVDLYAESIENEQGDLVFNVAELSEGTGTREAALRLKNEIINLMRSSGKNAVIDFNGVNVITSSFVDELIAKLFIELGLFQFNRRIKMANMSITQQQTLQKSIVQRIIDEYK